MKCSRCKKKLPEDEEEDCICRECAIKEWEKILSDEDDED